MAIKSQKYPRYVAHAAELKTMLDLGTKLPDNRHPMYWHNVQGYVVCLEPRWEARGHKPDSRKPHRLVVECKGCDRWLPFGRLRQHEKACCPENM